MIISTQKVEHYLADFQAISLKEMDKVKFMNRTDTKFIFHQEKFPELLNALINNYRVLNISKKQLFSYKSIYFDTPNYNLYLNHANGRLNRYKIRKREYVDSGISFFEIKLKSNKSRTIKNRIAINDFDQTLNEEQATFLELNSPYKSDDLVSVLGVDFSRITFVNKEMSERVTLDIDLVYSDFKSNEIKIPGLGIAELKQDGFSYNSGFVKILKSLNIYPASFSKYCTGIISFNENIKYNSFKPRLLKLNKTVKYDAISKII